MKLVSTVTKSCDVFLAAPAVLSPDEKLRLAVDASGIGCWDVETDSGRLGCLPQIRALFGIPGEGVATLEDLHGAVHVEDRNLVINAYAAATDPALRAFYDVEYRTTNTEDGVTRWVAATGRGVFDDAGMCERLIGTARDITARRLLNEKRSARDREYADRREQFIAVLGHDLKNPLAAVASASRIIMRSPELAAEMCVHIDSSVLRMNALIDNVLDFARVRLGGGFATTRDSEEPLEPVLLQIIEELRIVHPDIDVVTDFHLPEPVDCDRLRMGQLLSNLLGNAVAHGTANAPIVVRARSDVDHFTLHVTNLGPTIDASDIAFLFEPFFRGKAPPRREGLGLGLYICAEIAKAHVGTISVGSEGGTTSFTLRMPRKCSEAKGAILPPKQIRSVQAAAAGNGRGNPRL